MDKPGKEKLRFFAADPSQMTRSPDLRNEQAEEEKAKAESEKAKAEAERARAEADKAKAEAERARAEADKAKSEADNGGSVPEAASPVPKTQIKPEDRNQSPPTAPAPPPSSSKTPAVAMDAPVYKMSEECGAEALRYMYAWNEFFERWNREYLRGLRLEKNYYYRDLEAEMSKYRSQECMNERYAFGRRWWAWYGQASEEQRDAQYKKAAGSNENYTQKTALCNSEWLIGCKEGYVKEPF